MVPQTAGSFRQLSEEAGLTLPEPAKSTSPKEPGKVRLRVCVLQSCLHHEHLVDFQSRNARLPLDK